MIAASSFSQSAPALTLEQAVAQAVQRYPSVRVSQEQVVAAAAGIQLARTAYLPRVDAIAGVDRATRNNIFGLLLPSQVIGPISGPVLGTNDLRNVWGSTAGFLVSWEPFDFGLRPSNIAAAEASRTRAQADVARTQFELGTVTADTFLTLIAAQETVHASLAGVRRADVLIEIVGALVRAELRPGAELSRAQAERAAALTQLIRAEQAVAETKAALAQFLGIDPARVEAMPGNLLQLPSGLEPGSQQVANNPIAREQNAVTNEARARLKALERSYVPRFNLQGAAYARGSGALSNGAILGGVNGLGPTVQNWGVGFTATFPLLDLPALHAREAAQASTVRAERGRYDQVLTELTGRVNAAKASLEGARRVAENTPVQVEAARATLQQSTARYRAGLGTIVEVADAQRLVTQSEIDDALARLGVWRAKLTLAAAQGNILPVLQLAGR
ncbi:MAG: TolC family protein [Bryobacteraceae bacterium]